MTPDILLALVLFAFVSSITPGPNNLMLLASGMTFGFRRTIPHMLGIGIGFTLMVAVVGLGMTQVFQRAPALYKGIEYAGALYILWLAWRIARSGPVRDGVTRGDPMTFLQAAAFQWINPKAWVMAVGATAAYATPALPWTVLVVAGVFGLVNVPSVSTWALFGVWLKRLFRDPRTVRIVNAILAGLLVASLWPIFIDLAAEFR